MEAHRKPVPHRPDDSGFIFWAWVIGEFLLSALMCFF